MALIHIANQLLKQVRKKSTIRFTPSICPDCNMILDAGIFYGISNSKVRKMVFGEWL